MSVRNFDKLFAPRSVALIGASSRPSSIGAVIARNLRRAGFAGELMLVNPHRHTIDGLTVHPDAASLPQAPDLAIIVTPPDTQCLVSSARSPAGYACSRRDHGRLRELGEQGGSLQRATLDAAKPHLMRIVGPIALRDHQRPHH